MSLMQQIKCFTSMTREGIEQKVNEFLRENESRIEIIDLKFSYVSSWAVLLYYNERFG